MNCIIIRYSEIALKGKNRHIFENRLIDNIHVYLKKINVEYSKIIKLYSRIIILTDEKPNLKPIFGIINYSVAQKFNYDEKVLNNNVLELAKKSISKDDSFRVSVQRVDKNIGYKSTEMERNLGGIIYENVSQNVSLKNFDKEIAVELVEGEAYVFDNRIDCLGGLPLGADSSSAVLIENNNSLLATLLLMKRGIFPAPILNVNNCDISLLNGYMNIQKKVEIIDMKDKKEAFDYIIKNELDAVIVGDLLDNIEKVEEFLVLRPLVYMSQEECDNKLNDYRANLL